MAIDHKSAGDTESRRLRSTLLGTWNSPVTSYYLILGTTVMLTLIGLVMVLSASSIRSLNRGDSPYAIFLGQAQFAIIGAIALVVTASLRPAFFKKTAWVILAGAIGLQLLIFVPGLAVSVNGNTNWINLGFVQMQPSEVAKLALAIWLGMVLARKQRVIGHWVHGLIPAVPVAGIVIGLVLVGHDLGTALILMLILAGALWVAGVPMRVFAFGAGLMAVVAVAFIQHQGSGNRLNRISAWLGDDCDLQAACYQTKHGLWALGTGGWGGAGLGASAQKWLYLPEAHNDFIFAIIGEELGLIGTLLILTLFGVLGLAMTRVVIRHPDPFVKIATAGIAAWILGQALVNIGVVIGMLPVIGIPLPLVSAGGSALIMTLAAIGVVLCFARDEPGAREALGTRSGVVRRSLAVVGRAGSWVAPGRRSRSGSARGSSRPRAGGTVDDG